MSQFGGVCVSFACGFMPVIEIPYSASSLSTIVLCNFITLGGLAGPISASASAGFLMSFDVELPVGVSDLYHIIWRC